MMNGGVGGAVGTSCTTELRLKEDEASIKTARKSM